MEEISIEVGLDIVEIERVKKVYERHKTFIERIFSIDERCQIRTKKNIFPSLAAHFAAKEAFIKAMGGKYPGWCWRDVEILYGLNGKPEIRLKNKALEMALQKRVKEVKVSLSHTNKYAVAIVILTIKGESNEGKSIREA